MYVYIEQEIILPLALLIDIFIGTWKLELMLRTMTMTEPEIKEKAKLCDELLTWKSVAPFGEVSDVVMSSRGLEVPRKSR